MDGRARQAFLLLVLAQACHSVEEYRFALYDRLAPVRSVSLLLSDDPQRGFLFANLALVALGLLCWAVPVRGGGQGIVQKSGTRLFATALRHQELGRAVAWAWAGVESANGIGHLLFAAEAGGYFPGVATAPLLLAASLWLIARLSRTSVTAG